MSKSAADITGEFGPFPGVDHVHGVSFDGQKVWFAAGDTLKAFDPANGKMLRSIDVAAHAGTAFDGEHLYQLAEDRIQKIDPEERPRARHDSSARRRAATQGSPGRRARSGSGSIGTGRFIKWIPKQGRFCAPSSPTASSPGLPGSKATSGTGHSEADESELRRIDPRTGKVLQQLDMPPGVMVSGLESDGGDRFFCGGGKSGKVRTVRRPKKDPASK